MRGVRDCARMTRSYLKRARSLATAALALGALAATSAPAARASGPELRVPKAELQASFKCPIDPTDASKTPIMLVTGTGATGDQAYLIGEGAFERQGHPVCYVNFPDFTTADIQLSVQYLVYGLRREYKLAGRKVAVIGISQGGLLPRFALTYWPDLRRKVSDIVSAAGTHHGTNVGFGCSASEPCAPAYWQQNKGSNLLRALNSQPDETPGNTSYTTVRSLTDESVQPQGGPRPTSALEGASNILIQDVCPGRETTHIGTVVDSVTFQALIDAVFTPGKQRKGAAKPKRFPPDTCDHPYAPGLDEATTTAFLLAADSILDSQQNAKTVAAEPRVRKVFKRRAR
jgi:hypothetical protein